MKKIGILCLIVAFVSGLLLGGYNIKKDNTHQSFSQSNIDYIFQGSYLYLPPPNGEIVRTNSGATVSKYHIVDGDLNIEFDYKHYETEFGSSILKRVYRQYFQGTPYIYVGEIGWYLGKTSKIDFEAITGMYCIITGSYLSDSSLNFVDKLPKMEVGTKIFGYDLSLFEQLNQTAGMCSFMYEPMVFPYFIVRPSRPDEVLVIQVMEGRAGFADEEFMKTLKW